MIKYTVNFYVDDDLVATKQVEPYSKINAPSLEETAGYTIDSWHVEGYNDRPWVFAGYYADRVTESVNLYADFSYNQYTISFVDEKFNKEVESLTVTYNHEYSFEKLLSETGYTFNGCKEKNADTLYPTSGVFRFAGDVTLYSLWDANTYHVTLDPNKGSCDITEKDIIFDSHYTLPTPERLNYVFTGWFDSNNSRVSADATWKFDHDVTLTAQWTNVTNTYIFDTGDGECSVTSMQIGWEDPFELPTPTINSVDEEGFAYVFVCWTLDGVDLPQSGESWTYSNVGKVLVAKYSTTPSKGSLFIFEEFEEGWSVRPSSASYSVKKSVIPSYYEGKPVLKIEDSAFQDCEHIEYYQNHWNRFFQLVYFAKINSIARKPSKYWSRCIY